jgi:hypothetical protein
MMQTSVSKSFNKATIIPVATGLGEVRLDRPLLITDSLTFENVEGWLTPERFSVWRDWLSRRDRESLSSVRYALLHYFDSSMPTSRADADSDEFAFKVFACLRIIKPTRNNFEPINVEFKDKEKREIDVVSVTHPSTIWPNVPDAEAINSINLNDIDKLKELLPAFLDLASKGPENITRAVRFLNEGYSEVRDPTIQIVVWCMGIESLLGAEDADQLAESSIKRSIDQAVGLKTDIYDNSAMREYMPNRRVEVGELVDDLFRVRNLFVHGHWIPSDWKSKYPRTSLSGDRVHYVDVLREAASFILRQALLHHLETRQITLPFPKTNA